MTKNNLYLLTFGLLVSIGANAQDVDQEKCHDWDKLNHRASQTFRTISTCDSVSSELFGAREALADNGIGIQLLLNPGYSYDILGHNAPEQLYGGQNPTWTQAITAYLTYDLSRIGLDNSQFIFSGTYQSSNFPTTTSNLKTISALAINQTFFDKQLELQYGYWPLIWSFYGYSLTGSSTSALGPSSMIPVEVGLSYDEPTPAFNVIVRDQSLRFYNHASITRSNSSADLDENSWGLKWDVGDARALYIDELGFKQEPINGQRSIWLRAGMLYNTTQYTKNFASGTTNNYGGYLAGTVQLSQPYKDHRGLYFDAKVNTAKSNVNLIDKDYQVSLFYISPFESRPDDIVALGYSKSYYSWSVQKAINSSGGQSSKSTDSVQFSYSLKANTGLYVIPGLTWTKNPTSSVKSSDALIFQCKLVILI